MSVTETLVRFVLERGYADFPAEVVRVTKEHVLDVFGAMLAGYDEPAARIAMRVMREAGGTPEAGVVGGGFRTSVANVAFVNGISGHTLEIEAVGRSPGSDTLTLVAAGLSMAERLCLSGRQLIEFIVLGEEFQGRVGMGAPGGSWRGHCGLNLYAPPAIAAVCGKVLGLDVTATRMAVGLAMSRASGYYRHTGTMAHTHEAGLACRSGIEAALLAAAGMSADADLLEGKGGFVDLMCHWDKAPDYALMAQGLGDPYYIVAPGTSVKKYGCCFLGHRPMEALLQLMAEHSFGVEEVETVRIEVNALTSQMMNRPSPRDGDEAKFSMQHVLAAALVDGMRALPMVDAFSDAGAVDGRYARARALIEMVESPAAAPGLATGAAPPVVVRLKNGTTLERAATGAAFKGSPENPLSVAEMHDRFRRCAGRVLTTAQVERVIAQIERLEDCVDLSELMEIGTFGMFNPRPGLP